jgi:thiazole synthase
VTTTDTVVIGGGIAGLTIALAAADQQLSVTVVDLAANGAASRAAAGMLAPSLEGMPASVLPYALQARDYYPEFLADLREQTGLAVGLNRKGILELADRDEDLSLLRERMLPGAEFLSPTELAALEPALAMHAGAILHPNDGAVDNLALMRALESAVERRTAIRMVADRVTALDPARRTVTTAGSTQPISTQWIVLAAGAWAAGIGGLPRHLPVKPVRGQLLNLRECPLRHVMYAPRTGYLIPRAGTLVVGATIEQTDFVNETTAWGRQELLSVVTRTLPTLATPTVLEHWAGLRPMTPDTLPILGSDPAEPALVYATGFSRNGILLAPWAARQIVSSMVAERPSKSLDSFRVDRFPEL